MPPVLKHEMGKPFIKNKLSFSGLENSCISSGKLLKPTKFYRKFKGTNNSIQHVQNVSDSVCVKTGSYSVQYDQCVVKPCYVKLARVILPDKQHFQKNFSNSNCIDNEREKFKKYEKQKGRVPNLKIFPDNKRCLLQSHDLDHSSGEIIENLPEKDMLKPCCIALTDIKKVDSGAEIRGHCKNLDENSSKNYISQLKCIKLNFNKDMKSLNQKNTGKSSRGSIDGNCSVFIPLGDVCSAHTDSKLKNVSECNEDTNKNYVGELKDHSEVFHPSTSLLSYSNYDSDDSLPSLEEIMSMHHKKNFRKLSSSSSNGTAMSNNNKIDVTSALNHECEKDNSSKKNNLPYGRNFNTLHDGKNSFDSEHIGAKYFVHTNDCSESAENNSLSHVSSLSDETGKTFIGANPHQMYNYNPDSYHSFPKLSETFLQKKVTKPCLVMLNRWIDNESVCSKNYAASIPNDFEMDKLTKGEENLSTSMSFISASLLTTPCSSLESLTMKDSELLLNDIVMPDEDHISKSNKKRKIDRKLSFTSDDNSVMDNNHKTSKKRKIVRKLSFTSDDNSVMDNDHKSSISDSQTCILNPDDKSCFSDKDDRSNLSENNEHNSLSGSVSFCDSKKVCAYSDDCSESDLKIMANHSLSHFSQTKASVELKGNSYQSGNYDLTYSTLSELSEIFLKKYMLKPCSVTLQNCMHSEFVFDKNYSISISNDSKMEQHVQGEKRDSMSVGFIKAGLSTTPCRSLDSLTIKKYKEHLDDTVQCDVDRSSLYRWKKNVRKLSSSSDDDTVIVNDDETNAIDYQTGVINLDYSCLVSDNDNSNKKNLLENIKLSDRVNFYDSKRVCTYSDNSSEPDLGTVENHTLLHVSPERTSKKLKAISHQSGNYDPDLYHTLSELSDSFLQKKTVKPCSVILNRYVGCESVSVKKYAASISKDCKINQLVEGEESESTSMSSIISSLLSTPCTSSESLNMKYSKEGLDNTVQSDDHISKYNQNRKNVRNLSFTNDDSVRNNDNKTGAMDYETCSINYDNKRLKSDNVNSSKKNKLSENNENDRLSDRVSSCYFHQVCRDSDDFSAPSLKTVENHSLSNVSSAKTSSELRTNPYQKDNYKLGSYHSLFEQSETFLKKRMLKPCSVILNRWIGSESITDKNCTVSISNDCEMDQLVEGEENETMPMSLKTNLFSTPNRTLESFNIEDKGQSGDLVSKYTSVNGGLFSIASNHIQSDANKEMRQSNGPYGGKMKRTVRSTSCSSLESDTNKEMGVSNNYFPKSNFPDCLKNCNNNDSSDESMDECRNHLSPKRKHSIVNKTHSCKKSNSEVKSISPKMKGEGSNIFGDTQSEELCYFAEVHYNLNSYLPFTKGETVDSMTKEIADQSKNFDKENFYNPISQLKCLKCCCNKNVNSLETNLSEWKCIKSQKDAEKRSAFIPLNGEYSKTILDSLNELHDLKKSSQSSCMLCKNFFLNYLNGDNEILSDIEKKNAANHQRKYNSRKVCYIGDTVKINDGKTNEMDYKICGKFDESYILSDNSSEDMSDILNVDSNEDMSDILNVDSNEDMSDIFNDNSMPDSTECFVNTYDYSESDDLSMENYSLFHNSQVNCERANAPTSLRMIFTHGLENEEYIVSNNPCCFLKTQNIEENTDPIFFFRSEASGIRYNVKYSEHKKKVKMFVRINFKGNVISSNPQLTEKHVAKKNNTVSERFEALGCFFNQNSKIKDRSPDSLENECIKEIGQEQVHNDMFSQSEYSSSPDNSDHSCSQFDDPLCYNQNCTESCDHVPFKLKLSTSEIINIEELSISSDSTDDSVNDKNISDEGNLEQSCSNCEGLLCVYCERRFPTFSELQSHWLQTHSIS